MWVGGGIGVEVLERHAQLLNVLGRGAVLLAHNEEIGKARVDRKCVCG